MLFRRDNIILLWSDLSYVKTIGTLTAKNRDISVLMPFIRFIRLQ